MSGALITGALYALFILAAAAAVGAIAATLWPARGKIAAALNYKEANCDETV